MCRIFALYVIACFALLGCTTRDASYDSLAEVNFQKGWIPKHIPMGASNLKEVHNLDTGISALAFDIPQSTTWPLPDDCRPVSAQGAVPNQFSRSWWPSESELASSYSIYQCMPDGPPDLTYMAISRSRLHGLHWRTYAR